MIYLLELNKICELFQLDGNPSCLKLSPIEIPTSERIGKHNFLLFVDKTVVCGLVKIIRPDGPVISLSVSIKTSSC